MGKTKTWTMVGVGPSFVCSMAGTDLRGESKLQPGDGPSSVGKTRLGLFLG